MGGSWGESNITGRLQYPSQIAPCPAVRNVQTKGTNTVRILLGKPSFVEFGRARTRCVHEVAIEGNPSSFLSPSRFFLSKPFIPY